eukprot:1046842-Pyramimonas_sp.AAC.1
MARPVMSWRAGCGPEHAKHRRGGVVNSGGFLAKRPRGPLGPKHHWSNTADSTCGCEDICSRSGTVLSHARFGCATKRNRHLCICANATCPQKDMCGASSSKCFRQVSRLTR